MSLNKNFSRRSFVKKTFEGSLFSIMASYSINTFANRSIFDKGIKNTKPLIIGIIGAENSHTAAFGKLFNIDKLFPGLSVKYVWGETENFARIAMKKGNIPNMVNDPNEMLGKIDALIVDHRHGKYHLDAALPFLEEGIPMFIDKPFCYRKEKGEKFLALARKSNTPVTSYSSVANSFSTMDIKRQINKMGKIKRVISYGPIDLESKYGGVFFYGPHLIEPLIYIFENKVVKVKVNKIDKTGNANMIFDDGMMVTIIFSKKNRGWQTFVESDNGFVEVKPNINKKTPTKSDIDMVNMFRTGKEPRDHKNILHGVAILEALEKSAISEAWENVI